MPGPARAPIRVVVVEDEPEVRAALADVVTAVPSLELAGQAGDADEGLRVAVRTRPDVVLADVRMPAGGGVRLAREVSERLPATSVVALSAYEDGASRQEMLAAGAREYAVKGIPITDLVAAIHRAAGR